MQRFFIIVIFLFPLTSFGQRNINVGPGILNIDFEKLPTVHFFADTMQASSVKRITVIKDQKGEFVIKNHSQVTTWFKPEGLWLDYSIFIIRVDTIIGKWYRVFVNNEKGITLWTKAELTKKFVKWQTFLVKQTTAIDKHPDFNFEIKALPYDSATTIKSIEQTDCFEAIEIKGDWMRIRTNTKLDCNESKKTIKSGWFRWRQKNRLTIKYSLTC